MVASGPNGAGIRIGIAAASWNQDIHDRLLDAPLQRCAEVHVESVTTIRVPGALELPLGAQKLFETGCDGVVAIGTVIKGETDHYEIVARESNSGLMRVSLDAGKPVGNAILAVRKYEHAIERAGVGSANKGVEALDAVVMTILAINGLQGS